MIWFYFFLGWWDWGRGFWDERRGVRGGFERGGGVRNLEFEGKIEV